MQLGSVFAGFSSWVETHPAKKMPWAPIRAVMLRGLACDHKSLTGKRCRRRRRNEFQIGSSI
ncbi:hypothetical protein WS68_16385 [Burkholderia sp. TSV86]|nr:hypothetical protein WS68_16385 [Burkholderia sp. TSV86]